MVEHSIKPARSSRAAAFYHPTQVAFDSTLEATRISTALPTDLADVSQYPNLIRVLLARGYTDEEIGTIASGNVLRVWQTVEDFAGAVREGAS